MEKGYDWLYDDSDVKDQAIKEPGKNGKPPKKKKAVWIVLGIILALLLVIGIGGYAYVRNMLSKVNTVDVDTEELDAAGNQEVVTIALYGIDGDNTMGGRSDAIMLFTLDPNMKSARLCSIMRDSYVNIEGYGMDKINHAYAYGGPELAMKTLNQNFGLNITHFAAVDFNSLPQIIDMLGGVNIEITAEEVGTGSIPGVYESGMQTLSGDQALAYSRIRYATGNDYQRTQRQRNVINQMIIRIIQQPLSSWPVLATQIIPLISTNYSANEIIDLAVKYGSFAQHGIKETRFPLDGESEGAMIDGVYYLTFDIPTLAKHIQDFVFQGIMP